MILSSGLNYGARRCMRHYLGICIGSWLFFGLGLKRILKDPGHQRIFNVAMAVLLVPMTHDLIMGFVV